MSIKAGLVACAAGTLVAGSIALGSVADRERPSCPAGPGPASPGAAAAGHRGHHGHANHGDGDGDGDGEVLLVGPTCNLVEMIGPQDSTYRPRLDAASRADRARARSLLEGVNEFCRSHSASEIIDEWVPGEGNPDEPSHYFNPDKRGSLGLDPSEPRAVLVYRQRIGGVMFTGAPLPHLGSIPRIHTHDTSGPREMLHVYCTTNLAEAYTPSRQLGVLADSIALRHRIRPEVAYLLEPRLTAVLTRVRQYVGEELARVDPRTITTPGAADPALRARREEIRRALIWLTEPQLRSVLSMIR